MVVELERASQTLEHVLALSEDTRATVDDLVGQAVLVDVLHDALVVRAGLQPEARDAESLRLLEDAEGDLIKAKPMVRVDL